MRSFGEKSIATVLAAGCTASILAGCGESNKSRTEQRVVASGLLVEADRYQVEPKIEEAAALAGELVLDSYGKSGSIMSGDGSVNGGESLGALYVGPNYVYQVKVGMQQSKDHRSLDANSTYSVKINGYTRDPKGSWTDPTWKISLEANRAKGQLSKGWIVGEVQMTPDDNSKVLSSEKVNTDHFPSMTVTELSRATEVTEEVARDVEGVVEAVQSYQPYGLTALGN